jgi:hypothetical protein
MEIGTWNDLNTFVPLFCILEKQTEWNEWIPLIVLKAAKSRVKIVVTDHLQNSDDCYRKLRA